MSIAFYCQAALVFLTIALECVIWVAISAVISAVAAAQHSRTECQHMVWYWQMGASPVLTADTACAPSALLSPNLVLEQRLLGPLESIPT